MTITLNGTSGIVNDATDLSYTGTLTGSTGVVNIGSGQVYKDASGNVGIGMTPTNFGNGYTVLQVANASNGGMLYLTNTANAGGRIYGNGAGLTYDAFSTTYHAFNTNGSERARIDSSGNLLVGVTSSTDIAGTTNTGFLYKSKQLQLTSAGTGVYLTAATAGTQTYISFYSQSTGTGSISTNGSTTTYTTSSDYRLKENVQPMTGALAKVAALKPCTYTWTGTQLNDEGFIAHELQEVCPSAVIGEKDAVDADGNPVYQGIDTSFLVATLTAAIQEQQALITALTTRITALEAK